MPGRLQVLDALRKVQVDLPGHVGERSVGLEGGQDVFGRTTSTLAISAASPSGSVTSAGLA